MTTSRIQELRARIKEAQKELDVLEKVPEDNFDKDAVLLFTRQFQSSSQMYTYVALKVANDWWWYLTGAAGVKWPVLWERHLSHATEIWEVTEFTLLERDLLPCS